MSLADGRTAVVTGPQSCRLVTEYLFSPVAFDDPVFPAKDSWVHAFDQRYLRDVED